MRVTESLRQASQRLRNAGIDDSSLEAQLLLGHALGVDRTRLLMSLDDGLTAEEEVTFEVLQERRLQHEPTAYIIGRKEFYDIELEVTPAAPVPRPETELVVEEALQVAERFGSRPLNVVDVGTGSGTIALTLAKHLPIARITASDISPDAIVLAKRNADKLELVNRVQFVLADLLSALSGRFDMIIANLPYVKTADFETLAQEIRLYEPRYAFDGGADGLQQIRRLLEDVPNRLTQGGVVILEMGWDQGQALRDAVDKLLPGFRTIVKQDLAGLDRLAVIEPST